MLQCRFFCFLQNAEFQRFVKIAVFFSKNDC